MMNTKNSTIRTLVALTTALTLAACGTTIPSDGTTGGGTGGGTTQATKYGAVILNEDLADPSTKVLPAAMFLAFDTTLPDGLQGDYSSFMDTCEVTVGEVTDPTDPTFDGDFVDAGETLTVTADGQAYTTFSRQTMSGATFYEANETAAQSVPTSGLNVNVPGATGGFAAFGTVAIPNTPAFAVTVPADGTVDANSTFTWTGTSGGVVMLSAMNDTTLEGTVDVTCFAKDDGSFSFPEAIRDDLAARDFTGNLYVATRMNFKTHRQGDSLLVTGVTRTQTFEPVIEERAE